ncbi:MAG: acetyl/propionyl-CoA carboxylase subunit alpha, partial [Gammaproteobacteria bacterium]|nr:acetyl/propionyl-CoA carboxylase subunit alpha [Gammaproteobacteria bacterium]
ARVREPTELEIHEGVIAAALSAQLTRRANAKVLTHIQTGWRNSLMPPERSIYDCGDTELNVEYRSKRDQTFTFSVNDTAYTVLIIQSQGDDLELRVNDRRMTFSVSRFGSTHYVHGPYGDLALTERSRFVIPGEEELAGGLTAPMPGKVLSTVVGIGDSVEKGDLLVIMEAMKMEHRIFSPVSGEVIELFVQEGDQVDKDAVLVDIKEAEAA